MDYKGQLNDKQYEAVTSNAHYLRIIAGAGSGKTRVLTFRIAYLIEKCDINPYQILAITFTNKAADEIHYRVREMLNDFSLNMRISTFHSFCARLLREDIKHINYPSNFTILDEDDQKKIIKKIIENKNINNKDFTIKYLLDYIANKKNNWEDVETVLNNSSVDYYEHLKAEIYKEYEDTLKKGFYLDFDDLILKTILILKENPHVLEKWQHRLKHILVDEFQDVDANQYLLLKLLAGKENDITVVGDPDQTIYTWRGADIKIILDLNKDFPSLVTINLEQNYRSTGNILKIANRLIQNNVHRLKKNLFTKASEGEEIHFFHGKDGYDEARYVCDNIRSLYNGVSVKYNDFAILYRVNSLTAELEKALLEKHIPYKIYGAIRFYQRKEIKDCVSFLKIALNFEDDLAFIRCLECMRRGIGDTSFKKIQAYAQTENMSILPAIFKYKDCVEDTFYISSRTAKALLSFVNGLAMLHDKLTLEPKKADKILYEYLLDCGYIDELRLSEQEERIDNIKVLITQLENYLKKEDSTLEMFLQDIALYSSQDEMENKDKVQDCVNLMTIHTAKGLEFENVFVYGLIDGIFPSSRAIQEKIDGLEEERRIFYVALTRAKKRLFLTDSGGHTYSGVKYPSRFLKEIKEQAIKQNINIQHDSKPSNENVMFKNGSIINHAVFGQGIVLYQEDGLIEVVFKDPKYGRKTLMANHPSITLIKG